MNRTGEIKIGEVSDVIQEITNAVEEVDTFEQ